MKGSLAIMQPYVFPYLGYFQLVDAVDTFVFYDDVHFIKRGWINRNQLLVNGKAHLFSIPLQGASQNKLIHEIAVLKDVKWEQQFFATLQQQYAKAPYYEEVYALVKKVFDTPYTSIAHLAIQSVKAISEYVGLFTQFEVSSQQYPETKGLDKADRLIAITQKKGYDTYVNPSGGKELYEKAYFSGRGVNLYFMKNHLEAYPQFEEPCVLGLSMIDVLMFCTKAEALQLIKQYKKV
ncbi:MAG: hypothetical protein CMC74_12845 [Flavobacteriaceae bacterium]|nr:hypothetical protein [Flavobacteriaceae bacterium]|tara:strand:- start:52999 stop:53706 length:708 start_codon:yes stop_codon:yes gene_type:complete